MPHDIHHTTAAVIVAAGKGIRFGDTDKKQFTEVAGYPVILWTLSSFLTAKHIDSITLVVSAEDILPANENIIDAHSFSKPVTVIEGGIRRQDSVFNGLMSLSDDVCYAAIHDGVRAATKPGLIDSVCVKAYEVGAALPAVTATDSTFIGQSMKIDRYIDRTVLWQAQTPQVFLRNKILEAHDRAQKEGIDGSDDGMLYKRYIGDVAVVEGDETNMKLTYQYDVVMLEAALKQRGRPEL
ncbi:2-C-methyl-D-erythritol 4-phosphate cytidylyltransferase [candidate division KSB1 bacterium]